MRHSERGVEGASAGIESARRIESQRALSLGGESCGAGEDSVAQACFKVKQKVWSFSWGGVVGQGMMGAGVLCVGDVWRGVLQGRGRNRGRLGVGIGVGVGVGQGAAVGGVGSR